jgi:hypothetical protein
MFESSFFPTAKIYAKRNPIDYMGWQKSSQGYPPDSPLCAFIEGFAG